MDRLPSEIILYITTFLDTPDIVHLQLVSHRFFHIARDNNLWRTQCFEGSLWDKSRRRRKYLAKALNEDLQDIQRTLQGENSAVNQRVPNEMQDLRIEANERMRILANWDPTYPNETVDWYSEFIQRSAPITTNWLQQPHNIESGAKYPMEVRGAGVFEHVGSDGTSMVVGPLDDGSICIWDVNSAPESRGRIVARSAANTLRTSQYNSGALRSRLINTGVTECVSIDSYQKRAYIAIQCALCILYEYRTVYDDALDARLIIIKELVEVDLETLQVVGQEKFPFSIAVISEAKHPTPITVGTNLSLHLHDPRTSIFHPASSDTPERVDDMTHIPGTLTPDGLISPQPNNYSPLFHPGPLSIVHISASPHSWDTNGEIYIAGRFSSILNYDRRYFPKLRRTIFSGARLCSMTVLPYPLVADSKDRMRRGELSVEQVNAVKAQQGNALVACGEYNSKGSLEMYDISSRLQISSLHEEVQYLKPRNQELIRNRQTSSASKLLSVSNHGTRLVFSDGGGNVKWVERDGFTGVREWNIGRGSVEGPRGLFGTSEDSYMDTSSGDIVRKILHTKSTSSNRQVKTIDTDDLILWTGEKLALLSFSGKPLYETERFLEKAKSTKELIEEREERVYGQTMKRALKMQADEARFVTGLGLGYR